MKVTINGQTWDSPVRNRHRRAAEQFSGISVTGIAEASDEATCAYIIGTVAAVTGLTTDAVDDALVSSRERGRLLIEIMQDTAGDIPSSASESAEGNVQSATA